MKCRIINDPVSDTPLCVPIGNKKVVNLQTTDWIIIIFFVLYTIGIFYHILKNTKSN